MKNYNEMANDVLHRIREHETKQRNRRDFMKKVIIPICCFCLVALIGAAIWQGDFFGTKPAAELKDSTIIGEKDYIEPETNSQTTSTGDVIGMVKYNGANYVQCSTTANIYTPDKYLGEASDFEGTYQMDYLSETHDFYGSYQIDDDIVGGLYMAKEDPNVLMVELKNSEYTDYVILIKEQ